MGSFPETYIDQWWINVFSQAEVCKWKLAMMVKEVDQIQEASGLWVA